MWFGSQCSSVILTSYLPTHEILELMGYIRPVAQSETSPIADPEVMCSIPARSHTFLEIDHEIFATVILLILLIQEGLVSATSETMCMKHWLT